MSIAKKVIPAEAYNYGSYNGFLYSYTLIKDVKSPIKPYNILPKGKCYIGAHGSDKLDEKIAMLMMDIGKVVEVKNLDYYFLEQNQYLNLKYGICVKIGVKLKMRRTEC